MQNIDPFEVPPMPVQGASGVAGGSGHWLTIRITRTEEQVSMMMQRFTAYIVEVSDFGRNFEVSHRYGDFEALHKGIFAEAPGIMLPSMPPKGVDGTDMAVVAMRKVELEKIIRAMIACPEVLMEKSLLLWKFLNLPNPAVIAGRFVAVPRSRASTLKTLAKLNDPKYKEDIYRLSHNAMTDLFAEALREFRKGDVDGGNHWCWQPGGRQAVCQLLAVALGIESARTRLLEADVIGSLLGLVERDESSLDDARAALNVVVAREADRFGTLLAAFLRRGGISQLTTLAQRMKSQEFVAKLLWLAWEAPARAPFSQPGGQGLRLLQALMQSQTPTCSLLGGVLLAGLVASGDFDADPTHRAEALRMVRNVLSRPEAATDPTFTKTLCGSNAALVRLASLLEDADLAPLILGLLCAARPAASKLGRIAGNLASIVADKGGAMHSEETRARAAELLLHTQGTGGGATGGGTGVGAGGSGGSAGGAGGAGSGSGISAADFERYEGIADHEESLEGALRQQLEDGVVKTRKALETQVQGVTEVAAVAEKRLKPLPVVDFSIFDKSFSLFKLSRENFEKIVRDSRSLSHNMESQLNELSKARPSSVDPHVYKERLLAAERIAADVKSQRSTLVEAESEMRLKQSAAEASSAEQRRAAEDSRRMDEEISTLRAKRSEKDSEANRLRHKANTPNLDNMKRQIADSLERNLAEAKNLQMIGQRVQQGDPDYLKEGENRERKIADLSSKLQQLKKQHQSLLQQQKELDFDPRLLGDQASRAESEALDCQARIDSLENRRLDADRLRMEKTSESSRDAEEVRTAQERKASAATRLSVTESEARRLMGDLQPLIQEQHSGWQRLLAQQKKLESDRQSLDGKITEASRAATSEHQSRSDLARQVHALIENLTRLQTFLINVDGDDVNVGAASPVRASNSFDLDEFGGQPERSDLFGEIGGGVGVVTSSTPVEDDIFGEAAFAPPPRTSMEVSAAASLMPPPSSLAASPTSASVSAPRPVQSPLDEFDAFLQEDTDMTFGASSPPPMLVSAPATTAPTSAMATDFGDL
eukprot:TRINITY_DN28825_c0_g1_i1.p1 TRINITY_DN28825_c0_g1~~TRINITY_DN28825_c0_g1_i1.p1  ORF type:complete len:1053 (-),score=239.45 TRINITY_DN28825_c0_g1_i1:75-3233(-)